MPRAPPDIDSRIIEETPAPDSGRIETLDVRELGPPKPLTETLERLTELPEDGVLVQLNDRAPQHLYPQLEDRGFVFETVRYDDLVATAVWQAP